jgi:uncharacterized membrane protein YqiK
MTRARLQKYQQQQENSNHHQIQMNQQIQRLQGIQISQQQQIEEQNKQIELLQNQQGHSMRSYPSPPPEYSVETGQKY